MPTDVITAYDCFFVHFNLLRWLGDVNVAFVFLFLPIVLGLIQTPELSCLALKTMFNLHTCCVNMYVYSIGFMMEYVLWVLFAIYLVFLVRFTWNTYIVLCLFLSGIPYFAKLLTDLLFVIAGLGAAEQRLALPLILGCVCVYTRRVRCAEPCCAEVGCGYNVSLTC